MTAPRWVPIWQLENFIREKADWLLEKIAWMKKNKPARSTLKGQRQEYLAHKSRALELARRKLEELNETYNFSYKKICVRNQKSRWGSCSRAGALSFNYKIALLPAKLAEYIIAHELCHLGEMNHSRKFWALVAAAVPDYRQRRKELECHSRESGNPVASLSGSPPTRG